MTLHRRHFLAAAAALATPLQLTLAATPTRATSEDARFVVVLLRGGMAWVWRRGENE